MAFASRANKREQRTVVVVVRGSERRDIGCASCASVHQSRTAPAKGIPAERSQQKIGGKTRMAPVAVRVAMNPHEPVMKPRRDFIGQGAGYSARRAATGSILAARRAGR